MVYFNLINHQRRRVVQKKKNSIYIENTSIVVTILSIPIFLVLYSESSATIIALNVYAIRYVQGNFSNNHHLKRPSVCI